MPRAHALRRKFMSRSRLPQFTHMMRTAPLPDAVAAYAGCVKRAARSSSGSSAALTSSSLDNRRTASVLARLRVPSPGMRCLDSRMRETVDQPPPERSQRVTWCGTAVEAAVDTRRQRSLPDCATTTSTSSQASGMRASPVKGCRPRSQALDGPVWIAAGMSAFIVCSASRRSTLAALDQPVPSKHSAKSSSCSRRCCVVGARADSAAAAQRPATTPMPNHLRSWRLAASSASSDICSVIF
mmetsp:Transcript_21066/g.62886  ORF Transcript_21066/g.62886 Transcript_21066/m.62886 type:complete len:241 (+) Transcript_21066:731-1453(+)